MFGYELVDGDEFGVHRISTAAQRWDLADTFKMDDPRHGPSRLIESVRRCRASSEASQRLQLMQSLEQSTG
jgi:hypothetical protein